MPKTNTNCLKDMRCPECSSLGPYRIEVICSMEFTDDGSANPEGADWGADSAISCLGCNYDGKVEDFEDTKALIAEGKFKCTDCDEWLDNDDSVEINGVLYCKGCTIKASCGCYVPRRNVIHHEGSTFCYECYRRIR